MQDATRRSDACALFVRSARGQRVDVATGTREDSLEIYDYQRKGARTHPQEAKCEGKYKTRTRSFK